MLNAVLCTYAAYHFRSQTCNAEPSNRWLFSYNASGADPLWMTRFKLASPAAGSRSSPLSFYHLRIICWQNAWTAEPIKPAKSNPVSNCTTDICVVPSASNAASMASPPKCAVSELSETK